MGSIILVIATNAPLLPDQCRRLCWRGFVGMSRAGGGTADSSGDIAIAFSTGAVGRIPAEYVVPNLLDTSMPFLPHQVLGPLFIAASDATEEAILNAILQSPTMIGRDGITAPGLDPAVLDAAFTRLKSDL
jgi:D-aminopeptidase